MNSFLAAVATTILFAVAATASSTEAAEAWPPKFANGLNTPKYTVLKACKNYTIRSYPEQWWSSFEYKGMNFEYATHLGFDANFQYISGTTNKKHEKIKMTCPVRNDITHGAGPNCKSTFRVSFYLDYKFQGAKTTTAPAPTAANMTLWRQPAQIIASRHFGGFIESYAKDIQPHFLSLGADLDKDGIKFDTKTTTVNEYDSPFQLFNRHNEVWFTLDSNSKIPDGQC